MKLILRSSSDRPASSKLRVHSPIGAASLVYALCLAVSLAACGGAGPRPDCKDPEIVQIAINPSTLLNEGEDGASRSVILRAYQLSRRDAFDRVVYDELWQGDGKNLLGDTLLGGPDEAQLVAGLPLLLPVARHPDAQFMAVAGKFRNAQGAWRTVMPLPPRIDPCDSKNTGRSPNKLLVLAVHSDLSFQPGRSP
jgi:type VI secretion system VasD/TssJ family lipoprotein